MYASALDEELSSSGANGVYLSPIHAAVASFSTAADSITAEAKVSHRKKQISFAGAARDQTGD